MDPSSGAAISSFEATTSDDAYASGQTLSEEDIIVTGEKVDGSEIERSDYSLEIGYLEEGEFLPEDQFVWGETPLDPIYNNVRVTSLLPTTEGGSEFFVVDVPVNVVEPESIEIHGDMTIKDYTSLSTQWDFTGLSVVAMPGEIDVTDEAEFLGDPEVPSVGTDNLLVYAFFGDFDAQIEIDGIVVKELLKVRESFEMTFASLATQSTSEATWADSTGNINVEWLKNGGSAIADYDEIRFYAKHTMKFTSQSGYELEYISLDLASSNNDYANGINYNGSELDGSLGKDDVRVYPNDEGLISLEAKEQVRFDKITVYYFHYEEKIFYDRIEVTKLPTKTAFVVGDTFDWSGIEVTAFGSGAEKVYSESDLVIDPADGTKIDESFIGEGKTATVKLADYGDELSTTFDYSVSEPSYITFNAIDDESELMIGDHVVFLEPDGEYYTMQYDSESNRLPGTSNTGSMVSDSGLTLMEPLNGAPFVVSAGSEVGTLSFYCEGEGYLALGGKGKISFTDMPNESSSWVLMPKEDSDKFEAFEMAPVSDSDWRLQWNDNGHYLASYENTQTNVSIAKLDATPNEQIATFADYMNSFNLPEGENTCGKYFPIAKDVYLNRLSDEAKSLWLDIDVAEAAETDLGQAKLRYEAWARALGKNPYDEISSSGAALVPDQGNDDVVIYALAASVALLSIGGAALAVSNRRRKGTHI